MATPKKKSAENFVKNIRKMENNSIQFKTNINCGECVASVKLHLDNA